MDATLERRLTRIMNRPTAYELAVTHPDGRSYLVRYTARKSRDGLYDCMVNAADEINALVSNGGAPEYFEFAKRAADGATMGAWAIRFTGRTQRDCICNGELPFIEDIQQWKHGR